MITSAGTTPGGWFQTINSYGTVVQMEHESQVYSANDTIASFNPLSEVLTGNTGERTEDILAGMDVVISDAGTLVFPTFGSLTAVLVNGTGTNPFQTGALVSFAISPTPATGTQIYAYVWSLWDATILATTTPYTPPVAINMGGDPTTGELHYSVMPVQIDGQSTSINGTIQANNPPSISSPTASANDGFFPYQTELKVTVFDLDGDAFTFGWFVGADFVGSGTSSYVGNVAGTWSGNDTIVISTYAGTQNHIDLTVIANETVTCDIIDVRGGTSTFDFEIRGGNTPPPQVGATGAISGVTAEAADLPEQRIGIGQSITFSAYGKDISGGTVTFLWAFTGSNNWTTALTTSGTISALPDGGYQSTYLKDISGEIVTSGTEKTAIALVAVTGPNSYTVVEQPVTLIANTPPTAVAFVVKNFGTTINAGGDLGPGDPFPPGTQFEFDAVATDPNGDIVEYYWQFQQPPGVTPDTLGLWGAKVSIDTAQYPSGSIVSGILTVTDRMGGTLVVDTPFVSLV
jgi:hypothetical protein